MSDVPRSGDYAIPTRHQRPWPGAPGASGCISCLSWGLLTSWFTRAGDVLDSGFGHGGGMTRSTTDSRLDAPSRFTTHDGLTLTYDDVGNRGGEPIVFLHGGTDSRRTWERLTPAVRDTHRLLLLDARGQGDSDRDPNGYDRLDSFVADVIALCEQVLDRPAVLVGASHGGVIAPAVAARRPDLVRGLLLLDPPLFDRLPSELAVFVDTLEGILATVASEDDRHAALRAMLEAAPSLSGEGTMVDVVGEAGVDQLAFAWSRVDPMFLAMMREATALDEPFALHDPIGCPIHVIRADPAGWMPCFRAEHEARLRELAPQASFVVAVGAGHTLHAEQPAWIADQLVAFVSSS